MSLARECASWRSGKARSGGRRGGFRLLVQAFLPPLEHVEFDEHERDQPEEGIPEIDEIALDAPVDGREEQDRVKDILAHIAQAQGEAFETIVLLQAHVNLEQQYDKEPHSG